MIAHESLITSFILRVYINMQNELYQYKEVINNNNNNRFVEFILF